MAGISGAGGVTTGASVGGGVETGSSVVGDATGASVVEPGPSVESTGISGMSETSRPGSREYLNM